MAMASETEVTGARSCLSGIAASLVERLGGPGDAGLTKYASTAGVADRLTFVGRMQTTATAVMTPRDASATASTNSPSTSTYVFEALLHGAGRHQLLYLHLDAAGTTVDYINYLTCQDRTHPSDGVDCQARKTELA